MKKLIILITILIMVIISGCGRPTYNNDLITDCEEGEYSLNKEAKSLTEEDGYDVDYIKISDNKDYCEVKMILKNPIMIQGTSTKSLPVMNCYKQCWAQFINDSRVNLVGICC